jgi:P-type conjugative transfer protein TrbJ
MKGITMNSLNAKQRRLRRNLLGVAFAAGIAVAFGPIRRAAACWFDPIIFDPEAMVEHVDQVAQLGQQVSSAIQQVKNQLMELAHLDTSVAPNVTGLVAGIQAKFTASLYGNTSPADQLNSDFPADMSGSTWAQYQSDETTWTMDLQQARSENRRIENQVFQDMNTTSQQVQAIVQASNSAPGETAAVQAHNDLLAVASTELAKLQALKAARSQLTTQRLARQQSELSFAAAEQNRVDADSANPAPPSETVVDPFQN